MFVKHKIFGITIDKHKNKRYNVLNKRKGGDLMAKLTEEERDILRLFALLLPKLSEHERDCLLYYGSGMAAVKARETDKAS
jgi:hypothetical protein